MNWLAVAAALAQGLIWLLTWLRQRQAITDAEHVILAGQLQGFANEIAKVRQARSAVRSDDPGSVRKPTSDDRPWNPDDAA